MLSLSISQILSRFSDVSILVIGDLMLDRYFVGDTARVSPEAPVPIVLVQDMNHRPGGAANVALNIRALGAKVTLIGVSGEDEAGNLLQQDLVAANIKTDIYQSSDVATVIKLRVLSRHQQLLRMDFEKSYSIDHTIEQELLHRFKSALQEVQLVILSDYLKGTLTNPASFIEAAKAANVPILVDPKAKEAAFYRGASWLTPNLKEFEGFVGACPTHDILVTKARALLASENIGSLLITQGDAGMTLIDGQNDAHHIPATQHEIYDVTGAGDTVIATLGVALAAGGAPKEAMALANLAAGISVTKLGAATVSLPELKIARAVPCNEFGVMDEANLLKQIEHARLLGKSIVFTNGCYDVLHAGHIKCLEMAKALGDYLIVAVNTDESIRGLKGEMRPINPLEDRLTVLSALKAVDWVIPFSDETPRRLLQMFKPDVLAKGGDYKLDQVVGAEIVYAYGGKVQVLNHGKTISSTDIINKIRTNQAVNNLEATEEVH